MKGYPKTQTLGEESDLLAAPNRQLARYNVLDTTHPGALMSVPDITIEGSDPSVAASFKSEAVTWNRICFPEKYTVKERFLFIVSAPKVVLSSSRATELVSRRV